VQSGAFFPSGKPDVCSGFSGRAIQSDGRGDRLVYLWPFNLDGSIREHRDIIRTKPGEPSGQLHAGMQYKF
jgi:hypothetical protein